MLMFPGNTLLFSHGDSLDKCFDELECFLLLTVKLCESDQRVFVTFSYTQFGSLSRLVAVLFYIRCRRNKSKV